MSDPEHIFHLVASNGSFRESPIKSDLHIVVTTSIISSGGGDWTKKNGCVGGVRP